MLQFFLSHNQLSLCIDWGDGGCGIGWGGGGCDIGWGGGGCGNRIKEEQSKTACYEVWEGSTIHKVYHLPSNTERIYS